MFEDMFCDWDNIIGNYVVFLLYKCFGLGCLEEYEWVFWIVINFDLFILFGLMCDFDYVLCDILFDIDWMCGFLVGKDIFLREYGS